MTTPKQVEQERYVGVHVEELGGGCPYRGYPNRFALDDRCPEAVPVLKVTTDELNTVERGGKRVNERIGVVVPTPVVPSGSYCQQCLNENIREKESGFRVRSTMDTGTQRGVLRGRRRRRR